MVTALQSFYTINQQDVSLTVERWWADVRLMSDAFFRLVQTPPASDPLNPVTISMIELHSAFYCVKEMACPVAAQEMQAHLLLAMQSLYHSFAAMLSTDSSSSNTYFRVARWEYAMVQGLLAQYDRPEMP